ncbi:MAG: hypothetical protein R2762_29550 [Bryobacteraceae bacterium]
MTAVILAALLLNAAAPAADLPFSLIAVEKIAGAVGFYSPAGTRVAGVKVGDHPHEIVFSPNRRFAYVSDNGILWMTYAGAGGNTISIIDLQSRTKAGVIDLGENRRPHGMAVDPRSGNLVVTTENPDGLLLVDPEKRKVLRRYDVKGEDPHMVLLGRNGQWAYVSNATSNTLAAVNLASGDVTLIPVGARPQGGFISRNGKWIYLTNSDGNSISIIDTDFKKVIGTIPTGKGPGRVAVTPDARTLVYNLQPGEAVGFADLATRKETGQVALGGKPLSLTMSPDGKYAFAGVQDQDKIFVVSIPERRIVKVIATPKDSGPDPALVLP